MFTESKIRYVLPKLFEQKTFAGLALEFAIHVSECHSEAIYKIILESKEAFTAYAYCFCVLERHDEALYKVVLEYGTPWIACWYMTGVLKGHDDALYALVKKDSHEKKKYEKYWCERKKLKKRRINLDSHN